MVVVAVVILVLLVLVPAGHRYRGEYHLRQGKSVDTRHGNIYMYIS